MNPRKKAKAKEGKKWIITTWTGRELNWGEFDTFQDGWAEIYKRVKDEDHAYDDYFVEEKI